MNVGTTEQAFPAPRTNADGSPVVKNAERIFIQSLSTNGFTAFISKTGVLNDGSQGGFELPPGASMILPIRNRTIYRIIAAGANQKIQVTYLAGL
jgi:hypothetical protein